MFLWRPSIYFYSGIRTAPRRAGYSEQAGLLFGSFVTRIRNAFLAEYVGTRPLPSFLIGTW